MPTKLEDIIASVAEELLLPAEEVKKYLHDKLYLKEREILIKRLHYKLSLNECGKIFKITGERVRQIQKFAEDRLRTLISNNQSNEYPKNQSRR